MGWKIRNKYFSEYLRIAEKQRKVGTGYFIIEIDFSNTKSELQMHARIQTRNRPAGAYGQALPFPIDRSLRREDPFGRNGSYFFISD